MLPCTSWGLDCTFPSSIGYSICFLFLVVSLCHCFQTLHVHLLLKSIPVYAYYQNPTILQGPYQVSYKWLIQMKYISNIHSLPKQYQIMGNCLANNYQTHAAKHSTLLSNNDVQCLFLVVQGEIWYHTLTTLHQKSSLPHCHPIFGIVHVQRFACHKTQSFIQHVPWSHSLVEILLFASSLFGSLFVSPVPSDPGNDYKEVEGGEL